MLTDITLGLLGGLVKVLVGAAGGAVITKRVEGRAKLITRWGHIASFTTTNGDNQTTVNTHEVVIRNAGKKPTHNVRVTHRQLPNFNVVPSLPYRVEDLPDGKKDIVFPVLPPGQQLTIVYLYTGPLVFSQVNDGIRSDETLPITVEAELQQKYPKWWTALASAGFFLGCGTFLYFLWRFANWIGL